MKIVIISDTHGGHEALGILSGDVLIHCGDGCNGFTRDPGDVDRLDDWFGRQQFAVILCIGGNHDFEIEARVVRGERVFRNAVYLQDEAYRHGDLLFYGSPWTPELSDWAFYAGSSDLRSHWAAIPAATDVLITHTAPRGILDRNSRGRECGCMDLRARLDGLQPQVHCFGHNHASAGTAVAGGITFINASMVNSRYRIARKPFEVEL